MKIPLLTLPLTMMVTAMAADPTLPEFNSKTLGPPPLSLHDTLKGGDGLKAFQFQSPEAPGVAAMRRGAPERKVTRVNGMPVLEPDPSIDYKMIVKAPDPAIDFKMMVKPVSPTPDATPAR